MKCPNCHVECVDNICPECNGYFDEDLLSLSETSSEDDFSQEIPAPEKRRKKHPAKRGSSPSDNSGSGVKKRRRAPVGDVDGVGDDVAPASSEKPGKYVSKYDQYWEDDEPPVKKAQRPMQKLPDGRMVPYGQGIAEIPESDGDLNGLPFDPLQMCRDVWTKFRALSLMQKVYSASAVLLCFFAIFPWYNYKSEEEATFGLQESGHLITQLPVFLFGVLPIVALVLQKQPQSLPQVPRKYLPLTPVACGFFSALLSVLSFIYLISTKGLEAAVVGIGGALIFSVLMFLGGGGAGLFGKK